MSQLVERKGFKIESTLPQKKKTKDKKAKPKVVEHVQIIDDDAPIPWHTVTETAPIHEQEIISVEDAPIVVGIIDERPSDVREKERFENMKRWRTGAFETIPEPGSVGPQPKPGKSSSSSKSRQKRNESDDSDPEIDRRQSRANGSPDLSPPRRVREKERFENMKRWRTGAFETIPEPGSVGPQPKPGKSSSSSKSRQKRNESDDSDPEIDRRQSRANGSPDLSPPRRKNQHNNNNNDDPSPPRRRRQSDDDPSPPRRRKHDDSSPPRKRLPQVDNDSSPPRRGDSSHSQRKHKHSNDPSPPRRRDSSPPRKRQTKDDDPSPSRRRDPSPPRKRQIKDDDSSSPGRRDPSPPRKRQIKDNDSSPPRRRDRSSPSQRRHDRYPRQESSPPSTHRRQPKQEPLSPSSTHHRQPKEEPSSHRPSKQETSPPSSQPAKSERRRLKEHKEQISERYTQWGRGLAQVRRAEDTVKDYLEQAQKPLARYADDTDLDAMLKKQERDDDPMLKYLTKKSSDGGDRLTNSAPAKPRYRGPDPQKNRFDIWPGYRWDGVDRSNGYEKKLFESIANRHAKAQEAYLWSVEDM
ncbi:unnamed protein product [Adineta steineri]|uniref:BUD13 homolog n=1 Tax=Adineta steineri TaxID=433720 RepID=A0A813T6J8_9BILA|nr:unnamed protein product [Adineta steineri]